MSNNRKALNFDLDTNSLKEYYPGKDYRHAYRDIEKYMTANGFEHTQWSGYITINPMSYAEMAVFTTRLSKEFTWLKDCVNKFHVTNVNNNYDYSPYLYTDNDDGGDGIPNINENEDVLDLTNQSYDVSR